MEYTTVYVSSPLLPYTLTLCEVTLLVTGAGFFSLSLFPKFFAPIAAQ